MSPFLGPQPWEAPDPLPVMRRELKLLLIEMNPSPCASTRCLPGLRLNRIVDDDDVAAPAGQRAPDRGSQAISAFPGAHLGLGILGLVDTGSRKGLFVPIGPHDRAAVIGELRRQIVAVADTDDLLGRVVPQQEGALYRRIRPRAI